jgi:molybdate transport repressor ModE-like protein
VLRSVSEHGSINAAAASLGISAPVAYRHIREIERTVGEKVLRPTPNGSELTGHGTMVLEMISSAEERLSQERRFTVACSPVTEELLTSSLPPDADLIVSDDITNLRLMRSGAADVVILDDPVHLFDDDSLQWQEVARMNMVHADRGRSYIRYRYGAQRIAFRHLDSMGTDYSIDSETLSLDDLINSGKSFFVDEILLIRKGIRIRSSTDPSLLRHSVLAVFKGPSEDTERLLSELLRKGKQYCGK